MNREDTKNLLLTLFIIGLLASIIMGVTFALSSASLNLALIKSYFKQNMILIMNFIPIFLLMVFLFLILNKLWLSYLITALIFTAMGIVNKLKLVYRDEPFAFIDIKLLRESLEMAKTYDLSLSINVILMILVLIGIGLGLRFLYKYKIRHKNIRLVGLALVIILSLTIFKGYYFDPDVYAQLGDDSIMNMWIYTESYQAKGLVYPFIHSIKDLKTYPPEAYDEDRAREDLGQYSYRHIADDKKVNIISLMLESYNDFSKFEDVDFNLDPYKEFHSLQAESIHGGLITNVFAGGTIDTERAFLTGYYSHPKYFTKTNSFVWYLKEQGYRTEAMHPITGSFYNRRNINDYLGFDRYDHFDNKYNQYTDLYKEWSFLRDEDFFDFIIEGYENSKKDGVPYFNFSVTYQNHGPYSDEAESELDYLVKKDHYNDRDYNIVNNYIEGIGQTDRALKKLFDYFRQEEEPTIIVVFGDHNPWLGQDNSAYKMLNINLDLEEVEGFRNYYETPYLIWGNQAAKEVTGRDLLGEGPSISPNFLMAEVFDYLGWEGNEYMQYISSVRDRLSVNHYMFFKENGKFTKELTEEGREAWQRFRKVEYYYSNNFNDRALPDD